MRSKADEDARLGCQLRQPKQNADKRTMRAWEGLLRISLGGTGTWSEPCCKHLIGIDPEADYIKDPFH